MAHFKVPKGWEIPERQATPEHVYLNRRKFLAALGASATAVGTAGILPLRLWASDSPYPAKRNPAYRLDRPITDEMLATHYNNFAEFGDDKDIWKLVSGFHPEPWTITISGLVNKPQTLDVLKLIRQIGLEERLYSLRCVEGWSIAVPWTGFPLNAVIDLVQPMSEARFVKFVSFFRPEEAPSQKQRPTDSWPRFQGLSLPEAMNELTILATGIYGHPLPKQSGAPIRLVVPWKYGFKSIKSIVGIEFTAQQPKTYWNDRVMPPSHFVANVNPMERYLDRSQAQEKIIGTWQTRPTQLYNGYGSFVAYLYAKPPQS